MHIQGSDKQANILVVDDTPENIRLLMQILSQMDYRVRPVTNGEHALVAAQKNLPDLVLLDIVMPDMDGYEICTQLKANPKTKSVPVIFLSALNDISDKMKAFQVGGVDYITKPFQTEEVLARVQTHLLLRSQQKELADKNDTLTVLNCEKDEILQEKDEILQIVSHDLKNPLNYILMATGLLQQGIVTDQTDILGKITKNSYRMLRLIENLLDINRIETGKMCLSLQKVELCQIISELVSFYEENAQEKRIKLHFITDRKYCIYADKHATHQVLDNLISNALKYSPIEKNVTIYLEDNEQFVYCHVQDEGPGLTDEDKQKVFGKFARLSAKPTGNENSTGLGLSIVKKLTEAMKGKVWVESEGKNKGATFVVKFLKENLPKEAFDSEPLHN